MLEHVGSRSIGHISNCTLPGELGVDMDIMAARGSYAGTWTLRNSMTQCLLLVGRRSDVTRQDIGMSALRVLTKPLGGFADGENGRRR